MWLSGILLRAAILRRAAFLFLATASSLCVIALGATHASAQKRPAGYDEGIVAVIARDLPALTYIVLVDSSGTLLMPINRIAETVGMTVQRPDSFRVLIPRSDDGYTTIDLRAHTIKAAGVVTPYSPAEIIAADGDLFVTTERLASLLQANATLDAATLSILLTRDPPFPAQQRIAIEQRRAVLVARDRANKAVPFQNVPYNPVTNPGVLDWDVTSSSLDPTSLLQVRLRAGVALWGGSLTAGGSRLVGRNADDQQFTSDLTARYHRVFPGAKYITQFEAGDIITAGLFARFLRGVQLTNAPQQRSYELGEILLRPDLPVGWQYEVLQNGALLGFSDAVTHDAVAIPLHTGSSPVSVRMYGPGGQQVESKFLYQTPTTLLARGRFEYAAAAGRCNGDACRNYGQIDARYAHWTKLTLGAGAEYMSDSTGSALRPYALGSFTTGTLLTGEVQIMPDAVYRGSFAIFPRESSTGTVSAGLSMPGFGRVSVLPDTRSRWDADASWDERLAHPIGPFRSVRAGIGGQGQTDGSISRKRISVASSLAAGYAEMRFESSAFAPSMWSARSSMLVQSKHIPLSVRPLVDGAIGIDHDGFALISTGFSAQHERYGAASLAAEWARESGGVRLSLSWSRTFRGAQAVARAVSDPKGNATSTMSLRGALSIAPDGHITTSPQAREGYGGVNGTVFLDRDGDGVLSKGDELIPDASLIIGDAHVVADAQGRFHAWSILPYGTIRVALDSTAAAGDPGWVTASDYVLTRPVPNTSIRVDVPLLETREIAGSVKGLEGVPTVAGLTIELVPVQGGAPVSTTTFTDGQYYITRVRPGRYTVRIAPTSLQALKAATDSAPIEIDVPRAGNAAVIDVPQIVLKPIG